MRHFLILAVVSLAIAGCQRPTASKPKPKAKPDLTSSKSVPVPKSNLTREQIADGWIQLFDGHSIFGWQSNDAQVNWSVADGVIQADSGPVGLLVTTVPFGDFELLCDFRMAKKGNSGIFLRSPFKPENPSKDCYELNICNFESEFTTGSFVGRKKTESEIDGEDKWMTYHIRVDGSKIDVKLDGQMVMQFEDDGSQTPSLKSGYIGLQKNSGKIEFRNVFLRPLGTKPIFNQKDLKGWREVPGSKSEFSVVDATIQVKSGSGFLETEERWSDFIVQFDAICHGDELNSGIFFRAMPGTEEHPSDGYELQIHNGFKNGDRSKPSNGGTGCIFRRNEARWVVPNDREWFTTTLVAHRSRFAVWIDGLQVTDWKDDRKPNENPRKGRRLEAGHISLQGHDPTTNLQFRNLKIAAFPKSGK